MESGPQSGKTLIRSLVDRGPFFRHLSVAVEDERRFPERDGGVS